jgi:cyclopropane-fatty-acyl-phospholipid synthase
MHNYARLMENLHRWTKPGATLFIHVFAHRELAYPFEVRSANDWMAEHFSPAV